jgi:hypothetical protein
MQIAVIRRLSPPGEGAVECRPQGLEAWFVLIGETLSTPPRPFTLICGTNSRVAMPWSLGMAGLLHAFRRDFRKSASFESR